MLSDERLDNGKRLTRTRCTNNPSRTERIAYVNPALSEFALVESFTEKRKKTSENISNIKH